MMTLWRSAIAALLLIGGAGCKRDPAPAPAQAAAPAAPSKPDEPLAGVWLEDFETRGGCSDRYTITDSPLSAIAEDCNDGEKYARGKTTWKDGVLEHESSTPSTGWKATYRLKRTAPGTLTGYCEVSNAAGETSKYKVTWTRQ